MEVILWLQTLLLECILKQGNLTYIKYKIKSLVGGRNACIRIN